MKISIIVAMSKNRVIGLNNQMPWHLSADLKKFKKITIGHPILMGRKTYESIGKPLPERTNIIISRNSGYQPTGCIVSNNIDSALKIACEKSEHVFVIGGSTLYEIFLPLADTLYMTQINSEFHGDTFFPELDQQQWLEIEREDINHDPDVPYEYSFLKYARSRQQAI